MSHTASLSFEVFPPKKEEEFKNIFDFLREAAKLHPDFISCTYGAGGYRTALERLVALNPGIRNPNLIYVGQKVRVA